MAYKDCFKIDSGKLTRKKSCPKCGEGVFMAAHKNRATCGKCSYSEMQKKES